VRKKNVHFLVFSLILSAGLLLGQTPTVAPGGVCNAASCQPNQMVAPGSLISIFGTSLASSLALADSIPLSTNLNGVEVTINDIPAPLLFVSANQINAQLPWNAGGGTANVVVKRNGALSAPVNFPVSNINPGIFTVAGTGVGQAVAYGNLDGAFAAPAGSLPGAHPAKIGDPATLVILATGLGPVDHPVASGDIPPPGVLSNTIDKPIVLVGGVPAQVVFSGLTPLYVGVYQINIIISPGTPVGDAVPLQIVMGGVTTTDKVTIAVTQ